MLVHGRSWCRVGGALVPVVLAVALTSYLGVGLRGQVSAPTSGLRGNAAVSGVVVDGATGQGVSMAEVVLGSPEAQYKVWTDATGRFVFNGVAVSRFYQLSATKVGYLRGKYGVTSPDPHFIGFAPLHIAGDEWVRDVEVTIWKPASISGTLRDELGRPLAGVFVRVQAEAVVVGERHLAGGSVVKSDDRGVYRVFGLTRGSYVALALPKGVAAPPTEGQRTVYRATYHPSAASSADATTISLAHAESREGVDIIVPAVPARAVSGRVVGSLDRFDHFTVRLSPRGDTSVGVGGAAALAAVAPDGSFRFDTVPEGDYQADVAERWPELSLRPVDGAPVLPLRLPAEMGGGPKSGLIGPLASSGRFWSYYPAASGAAGYWARASLRVGAGASDTLVLQLQPRLRVSGRVQVEGAASPRPASFPRRLVADPFGPTAAADPETGVFVLDGLTPGRYQLRLPLEPGYAIRSISWSGQDYRNQPIDLVSDVNGVVVTLTDQFVTFSGVVRDDGGRAATGAAVLVFPANPAHRATGSDAHSGFADASGRFAIGEFLFTNGRLPAGDYLLVAVAAALADRSYDPAFLEHAAKVATRVAADWGESPVVNLTLQNVRLP